MTALAEYIGRVASGAWSLAAGMSVTIRYMFHRPATVQYPRQRLELPQAYRGHIQLARRDGGHACVACGECYRTCPSGVIKVQGHKALVDQPNRARLFVIDFSRCSLCGLCVEVCPEGALEFSREYEQAGPSRHVGVVDLVARLEGRARL